VKARVRAPGVLSEKAYFFLKKVVRLVVTDLLPVKSTVKQV